MDGTTLAETRSHSRASLRRVGQSSPAPVHELTSRLKLAPDVHRHTTGMLVQGETKSVTWEFPASLKRLEIIQITDLQWGHICCNRKRVIEYRDWILAKPTRFMVWTGDNIDAATMQSKGTTWENIGTPQYQLYEFCEVWAPARHRILGYVGGNHERRCLPTFGDLGITIAALLQIPYSKGKQLIDVKFGKWDAFKINQWHGAGGAQTMGTVAQKLWRFASEGDGDLYLMGHHHKPMIIPFWKERRGRNGKIVATKTFAATGSSFLEFWGSYGEVSGYAPSDVLMPRAVIGADGSFELTLK